MPLYLGFDSSTQSLSAIAIRVDDRGRAEVVFERSLNFDEEFPQYATRHGVLPTTDSRVQVSSPRMWGEALVRMMGVIARSKWNLSDLRAVSGSAQQHGSVYLTTAGGFARAVSPIWMDTSTRDECLEITDGVGGAPVLAARTGSRACERFTGPQIRRFFKTDSAGYAATARIHLVSSYLASVLTGGDAPLDPGDASGMNLMDLRTRAWWPEALDATAPDLRRRLPAIVPSATVVGIVSPQWQKRFGFPAARVVAWSGDNPSSLIGTGLVDEGRVAVSLGTSDTVFGLMREPRVDTSGTGHVFGAPTGDFMGLTVFRNGSLARERIRDEHGLDWAGFSAALRAIAPGNDGALMLPWFEPEITPDVPAGGVRRFGLDPADASANVRAVVEAQMMAMANHSRWMGVDVQVIHATGGAAANRDVLQVMANVFGAEVYQFEVSNSASLGAALRAWHADANASGRPIAWGEIVRDLAQPSAASRVTPDEAAVQVYVALAARYAELEKSACHRSDLP